ncbi:MAG: accessory factor UbiK family protein [Rudaea sp.]|uniref:accessory factor UbiK family protein n=1 Tax=Rudaea sp. TaxID=2136325 RepID=UPI0039E68650
MISVSAFNKLARRLASIVVPPAFVDARGSAAAPTLDALDDLSANIKDALRAGLRELDLVTREEFDAQRQVLLRTRETVEALEHRLAELEARLGAKEALQ